MEKIALALVIDPMSGTWPSGGTRSLVLTVAPRSLAAFQIVRSLGAVGKFLRLLLQQKAGALVLELALDARTNLFERRRSRGLYGEQLENYIALWDLHHIGRSLVRFAEDSLHKLRIRGQSRQVIGSAKEFCANGSLTLGGSCFVESVRTRLAEQSVRCRFSSARRFLLLHFFFDLTLH